MAVASAFFRSLPSLVLVLLVLLAGCGGSADPTLDITYDSCRPLAVALPLDATEAEAASAAEAITMWNGLGVTQLTLDPVGANASVPLVFKDAPSAFFGLYEDETGTVLVNRALSGDEERAITIAHELGHAFGLLHVDTHERRSVMNKANLKVLPTHEDGEALEALRGSCAPEAAPGT